MQTGAFLEFRAFRIDLGQKLLLRGGETVPLTPKVFDLLLALVENQGRVVSKETLLKLVWPDTFVEETNLTKGVFVLRQTLGEEYIETLPKRGYRFTAEVVALPKPIRSLVVLPFVNLSGDASQEYFSDGLTEEVINALAPIPGLRVVARTSSFQFKGKGEDVRTIGQKLGVDTVLEGSVRISGDQLRVTAQLNDTRNGYHYWSHTWDHGMKDVFAVQQQIAREVVQALARKDARPAIKPLTTNLTAYDYYLQGLFQYQRIDVGALPQAVGAFEMALKEDPKFAAAYAWIARSYRFAAQYGMPPEKAFPLVRENVKKALALDPDLAIANAVQGSVSFYNDWDWAAAKRQLRRATELNPADGNAHHDFAHYLIAMGRFDEAFAESQKQMSISPIDVETLEHAAFHHIITGDPSRAIAAAERALAVNPKREVALRYLRRALELSGQFEKAIAVPTADDVVASPEFAKALRDGWKKEGAAGYWRAWRDYTRVARMSESLRARYMAIYTARLGQKNEMIGWLQKAIDLRDTYVVNLKVEPAFAPYRKDPDFQELVRKVGLPN